MNYRESVLIPRDAYLELVKKRNRVRESQTTTSTLVDKGKKKSGKIFNLNRVPPSKITHEFMEKVRKRKRIQEKARRRNLVKFFEKSKKKNSQTKHPKVGKVDFGSLDYDFLDNFPFNKKHTAARILMSLEKYKNYISWDPSTYEIIIGDRKHRGTNLIEILHYLITVEKGRFYKTGITLSDGEMIPKGTSEFYYALKTLLPPDVRKKEQLSSSLGFAAEKIEELEGSVKEKTEQMVQSQIDKLQAELQSKEQEQKQDEDDLRKVIEEVEAQEKKELAKKQEEINSEIKKQKTKKERLRKFVEDSKREHLSQLKKDFPNLNAIGEGKKRDKIISRITHAFNKELQEQRKRGELTNQEVHDLTKEVIGPFRRKIDEIVIQNREHRLRQRQKTKRRKEGSLFSKEEKNLRRKILLEDKSGKKLPDIGDDDDDGAAAAAAAAAGVSTPPPSPSSTIAKILSSSDDETDDELNKSRSELKKSMKEFETVLDQMKDKNRSVKAQLDDPTGLLGDDDDDNIGAATGLRDRSKIDKPKWLQDYSQ